MSGNLYNVKIITSTKSQLALMEEYKEWVESRKHIVLSNIAFSSEGGTYYCTVTYRKTSYHG